MTTQCDLQKGKPCIFPKGHHGACRVPDDSQDHSDEIRLRVLKDRVEDQAATIERMRKVLEVFAAAVGVLQSTEVLDTHPVYVSRGSSQWLVCFAGAFRAAKDALKLVDSAGRKG